MDYTIISSANIIDLQKQVKIKLNEGWVPQGGICMSRVSFIQAMIKN